MVSEGSDELSRNDELREYELSGSDCMTLSFEAGPLGKVNKSGSQFIMY